MLAYSIYKFTNVIFLKKCRCGLILPFEDSRGMSHLLTDVLYRRFENQRIFYIVKIRKIGAEVKEKVIYYQFKN